MRLFDGIAEEKRVHDAVRGSRYELIADANGLSNRVAARTVAPEVVQTLGRLMRRLSSRHGD
jgi:hypothetical protein